MNTDFNYLRELLTQPASGPNKPFMDLKHNAVFQQVRFPMVGYYGGYALNQLTEQGFSQLGWLGSFFAIDIPLFTVVYNFFKFRHLERTHHRLHQGLTKLEQMIMLKANTKQQLTAEQSRALAQTHKHYTGMDIFG